MFITACTYIGTLACHGQVQLKNEPKLDTAKLFDPKPDPHDDFGSDIMFRNVCTLIGSSSYSALLNEKQYRSDSLQGLIGFLNRNSDEVRKNRFFILKDSATPFKQILAVIENLRQLKIDNYRVIDIGAFFLSGPRETHAAPVPFETLGSTEDTLIHFQIMVHKDSYECRLENRKQYCKKAVDVASFIKQHKLDISKAGIIIITDQNAEQAAINSILEILKSNNINSFGIISPGGG